MLEETLLIQREELFLHDKKQAVSRFAATRKNYVQWNSDVRLIAKCQGSGETNVLVIMGFRLSLLRICGKTTKIYQ